MTEKYQRVLIANIYDKKENGFTKFPVYTEEEYMKEKRQNQGDLCELV